MVKRRYGENFFDSSIREFKRIVRQPYKNVEPAIRELKHIVKQPYKKVEPVIGELGRKAEKAVNRFKDVTESALDAFPDKVTYYNDSCNFGIQVTGTGKTRVRYKYADLVWRNPECSPPPSIPPYEFPNNLNLSGCGYWGFVAIYCYKANSYNENNFLNIEPCSFSEWKQALQKIDPQARNKTDQQLAQGAGGTGQSFSFPYGRLNGRINFTFFSDGGSALPAYQFRSWFVEVFIPPNNSGNLINELQNWDRVDFSRPQTTRGVLQVLHIDYPLETNPNCELDKLREPRVLPPPPPPMSCNCCPSIQSNDELLRLILKRIGTPQPVSIFDEDMDREGEQKAVKVPQTLFESGKLNAERTEITNRLVGIANYPIEVPETVIEPYKEGIFENIFSFFQGDKKKKINTLTEFLAWQVEQDSAVLGQFHQVIEFEQDFDGDGKPVTEKVVIPNVAEALKELMLLIVQLANNDGIKTGMLMNILAEVSNVKVNLFKTMQTVIDVQDYLDYPTRTNEQEVELLCDLTPTGDRQDFQDFMANSKVKVTFEDWTGEASLHDNMVDLLQLAAMIRTMYFQKQ